VENAGQLPNFIWSVADLLRGDYKQSEYGRVILPLTVIRRLDCVLEPTKDDVVERSKKLRKDGVKNIGPVLSGITGVKGVYNDSKFTLTRLLDDPTNIGANLKKYIGGFDDGTRDVILRFRFTEHIERLQKANLLYQVVGKFCEIDLHPKAVSNTAMGYIYEDLIRRFSEISNETAGEHFTPREVIRLMVSLLFIEDGDALSKPGVRRTMYDPACGTGGMLSVAEDWLRDHNPKAKLRVFGQELNDETYAICRSDMMLKGQDATNIYPGNSFTEDGTAGEKFDYMLANPPFGVEWKKYADPIKQESQTKGFAGRFGAGLPRINDGSLLFLQHMLAKMKDPGKNGTRLAIVFNGSPLFTGQAGSGESEIRKWIIESDWLEAVVALPDQLFYNTGISTYFWVLTNRKSPERRGKIQLVDARESWTKMRKSYGDKRKEISPEQIDDVTRLYAAFEENERSKIFRNEDFGFRRITVERPLRVRYEVSAESLAALSDELAAELEPLIGIAADDREVFVEKIRATREKLPKQVEKALLSASTIRDEAAPVVLGKDGTPEPDPELRDYENVPLTEDVEEYMKREVLPWVPAAWADESKTRVGYEIPLTRHFYKYVPPRPLEEIDREIKELEAEILKLLSEVRT